MTVHTGTANRCWLSACALVVIASCGVAPRARAQTLTNADVIKMVQAKLGDAVIISEIKHSTCKFDTSPDALIQLKQAGVSDKVLEAMTEAAHGGRSEGPAPTSANSNGGIPIPENYGLYAAANGKLLGIDVSASTMVPQKVQVRVWRAFPVRYGPPSIEVRSIPVLPSDVSFVAYGGGGSTASVEARCGRAHTSCGLHQAQWVLGPSEGLLRTKRPQSRSL